MTGDSRDLAGLYVHIPFCSFICPYCDFAVTTGSVRKRSRFLDALLGEIDLLESPLEFDTVYFGGGTPSILDVENLERVLAALRSSLHVTDGVRLFLEANPEHVTTEAATSWREIGVSFLSLGIQSFHEADLRFLHRRHTADIAQHSVAVAQAAGFETVSVDLIFGLPEQSLSVWTANLEAAAHTGVGHVSCYQLTIHDDTVFARWKRSGRIVELPEEIKADFFERTHGILAAAGFEAYEVSNFARGRRHRSGHNAKYWNHTPYLGVGPSAHSFDGRVRWWNHRRLEQYQDAVTSGHLPVAGREELSSRALALESVMLALRTSEGLDLDGMKTRFGIDLLETNAATIQRWCLEDYARLEDGRLMPTTRGLAVADRLVVDLEIPD